MVAAILLLSVHRSTEVNMEDFNSFQPKAQEKLIGWFRWEWYSNLNISAAKMKYLDQILSRENLGKGIDHICISSQYFSCLVSIATRYQKHCTRFCLVFGILINCRYYQNCGWVWKRARFENFFAELRHLSDILQLSPWNPMWLLKKLFVARVTVSYWFDHHDTCRYPGQS